MARHLEYASQFGYRMAMLVDPEAQIGVLLAVIYDEGGRLAASLVASRRLPSLEHRHQALREIEVLAAREGLSHGGDGRLSDQHVPLDGEIRASDMAEPGCTLRTAPCGASAPHVHDADLAHVAARILRHEGVDSLLRCEPIGK